MNHQRTKSLWVAKGCLLLAAAGLLAVGCGDDQTNPGTGSGGSGGSGGKSGSGGSTGKSGAPGKGGASGSAGVPAGGMGGASGASGAPGQVTYQIPAGGGEVELMLASGNAVTFAFPASAAGQAITLTADTAGSIGWGNQFQDVIRMEPDGIVFDDPVVIRPSNKDLLLFDFPSSTTKSAPEGLALNATKDGLLLNHFSTLAVVPAGGSCDSASGWFATANAPECTDFANAPNLIKFVCKAYTYCLFIEAQCCAPAGKEACELGMDALALTYTRNDGGGNNPYCVSGSSGGAGGGGGTSAGGGAGTTAGGTAGVGGTAGASAGGTAGLGAGGLGAGGSGGLSAGGAGGVGAGGTAGLGAGGLGGVGGLGAGGTGGKAGGGGSGGSSGGAGAAGAGGTPPNGCFAGGSEATFTGTGVCSAPYNVDMSQSVAGTVRQHTANSGTSNWTGTSGCATGALRHDVYGISPFSGWQTVQVSAVSNNPADDLKISITQSDGGCQTPEQICKNETGANACEYLTATYQALQTNYLGVIVSSNSPTAIITTSFRVY